MKGAIEMKQISRDNRSTDILLKRISRLIELDAMRGLTESYDLIENGYTLADVDFVITELVAWGYSVKEEETSESFLTKIKISW